MNLNPLKVELVQKEEEQELLRLGLASSVVCLTMVACDNHCKK